MKPIDADFFHSLLGGEYCFCGSKKQYEECHAKKIYEHPAEIKHDIHRFMRQGTTCPVSLNGSLCGKATIASHSIQRGGALKCIVEKGHVSTLMAGSGKKKTVDGHGFVDVSSRKASTFPGFCSEHDYALFEHLEQQPLKPNYRIALSLAEREAHYEAVTHTNASLILHWLASVPRFNFYFDPETQRPEMENTRHYASYNWALLKRLQRLAKRKSHRKLYYFSALIDAILPFAASGCFCIEIDPRGRKLQEFSLSKRFAYAQLSVLPQVDGTTLLCVSSLNDQDDRVSKAFVNSFQSLADDEIASGFLKSALNYTEKVFFRPSFLKGLETKQLLELERRADDSNYMQVGAEKPSDLIAKSSTMRFCGVVTNRSSKWS